MILQFAVVCLASVETLAMASDRSSLNEVVFESFDGGVLPPDMKQNNTKASLIKRGANQVLEVHFEKADWPNVFFTPKEGAWDWNRHIGIAVDIFNPEPEPVSVCMRVDNEGADGANSCITQSITARPGEWTTMEARFRSDAGPFWGMRGVPVWGPLPSGKSIDPSRIVAFQVFLPRPNRTHVLLLDTVRLFGQGGRLEELVPLPFVDRFGQYKHADWPGKIHGEQDLARSMKTEQRALDARPEVAERDRFGGWTEGPRLDATGWFRAQKVGGKWWLVTPEGHLFFSLGVDCVGTWERTFVQKRERWFEWLPDRETDTPFKDLYEYVRGAHSMAEPVNGEGWTFSFYSANLIRKYGAEWPSRWRHTMYSRLRSWGFNTIGNWSQGDVLDSSPMPFVASTGIGGSVRPIAAGAGYWGKMKDVYDPDFAKEAEAAAAQITGRYAGNPLCIGYFVDNELGWEDIRRHTLTSPPDQPCRIALIEQLKKRYGTVAKLNEAWATAAADWDTLRSPSAESAMCKADMDAYVYEFARRYFDTVNASFKRHSPHQLYLGCRFAGPPEREVIRACGDVADVMSFNLYYQTLHAADWTGDNDYGKPIIIGEFHFGALDRGMFHTGLRGTRNQKERAQSYARYVESVADTPAFVGCHWFQCIDEPITGRWFDGENYNIGFLTVTDTPYAELAKAARKTHAEIYQRRYAKESR